MQDKGKILSAKRVIKRKYEAWNGRDGARSVPQVQRKAFTGMPAYLPSRIVRVQEDALVNRRIDRVLYHERLA